LYQARNRILDAALLVAGVGIGAVVASLAFRDLKLKAGQRDLEQYASRALLRMEALPAESSKAANAVRNDNLPFCSDQDLALMRRVVFYSPNLKDLGRVKDGKLYCTTGIGRMPTPMPIPAADVDDRGEKFYALTPLAIAPGALGMVVEANGISIALNTQAYETAFDEPPRIFTGMFLARASQSAFYAFGHHEPLSNSEIMAQSLVERAGVFYQPLCSKTLRVCIVAAEPRIAMMASDQVFAALPLFGGALGGGCLALILILYFRRHRSLERRLKRAIRNRALTVVYQPVVDLKTRAIAGAEALARWTDEANEIVSPDVFIAAAEQGGFIHEITKLVLERVVEEVDDLLRLGNFQVTINITMQDLTAPGLYDLLSRSVQAAKIDASALGFELTERSTADPEAAKAAIARLKSLGHTVYIDDFGTGYSSLAYLHDLAVNAIKIDRAFTATVGTEAVTASVVPQILDIASQLDLMVVVEGIETERQVEYFNQASHGTRCILGQGWLLGKPVPAAEFRRQFHTGGNAESQETQLPVQSAN